MTHLRLATGLAILCLLTGCTDSTLLPVEKRCTAASFREPFADVDPCAPMAVLVGAVEAMFAYQPATQPDRRFTLRIAEPLLEPGFVDRARASIMVWGPVTDTQWTRWRETATTVVTTARITSDDHPVDTDTAVSRVVQVRIGTSNASTIEFAVYATVGRAGVSAPWRLTDLAVRS